jgi:hypothetical protein
MVLSAADTAVQWTLWHVTDGVVLSRDGVLPFIVPTAETYTANGAKPAPYDVAWLAKLRLSCRSQGAAEQDQLVLRCHK